MYPREQRSASFDFVRHLHLTTSFLFLLMALWPALPAAAQNWSTLPGAAMDVGANGKGDVWVIGTNPVQGGYSIWRWNNGNWQNVPGGATRIAVDTDGTAWVVNNTGNIFHSNANGTWTNEPGSGLDIAVGANGDLWAIGTNKNIYKAVFASGTRDVSSWQQAPGGAVRIAVGPDGNPWVVNDGGAIYRYSAGNWTQLPGVAKDIAVGPDGEAYVVGTNPTAPGGAAVYKWQGSNWTQIGTYGANVAAGPAGTVYVTQDNSKQFAILSNSGNPVPVQSAPVQAWTTLPGGATDIGANGKGDVWLIGADSTDGGHSVYRWTGTTWTQVPGGGARISVDADGTPWLVNNVNQIFHGDNNGHWTFISNGAGSDIGAGGDGSVWLIGTGGCPGGGGNTIWKAVFTPGTRTVASWQRVPGCATRIAVGPDGVPWVINSTNTVFQWQTSQNNWQVMPGSGTDIAIGADLKVYVVGAAPGNFAGGNAVLQRQSDGSWTPLNTAGVSIAAGPPGTVYVTQNQANQYAILSNSGLPSAPAGANDQAGLQAFAFCWRDTKGRGAGYPLSTNSSDCPAGSVKDPTGLLCYPPCKSGYHMVGPVCWEDCPSGFSGNVGVCGKPQAYGRGGGYAWQIGDTPFNNGGQFSRCQNDNPQGCEQPGGGVTLVYPKCKANFHAVGTNICSPDCPSDMTDTGVACQAKSYGNTAGQVLGCSQGLERSGLLCYTSCGANADGVGPVCWDHCPGNWVQCGAGCAKDTAACGEAITDQVVSVLSAAAMIASEVLTAGASAGIVEGSKTGVQAATSAEDAAKQASEMVEKLNLTEAIQNMSKAGTADASTVASAVKSAMVPTKLTMVEKGVDVAGSAATFFTTVAGVANNNELTPEMKNWQIAQTVLKTASLVDPTGIAGVVAAYTKPLCSVVAAPTKTASNDVIDLDSTDRQQFRQGLMGNW